MTNQSKIVYDIIVELASDNSKIFKEETLKKHFDNEDLKRVLKYAYDPMYVYHISTVELPFHMNGTNSNIPFALFDALSSRKITGSNAKIEILNTLNSSTPEVASIIKWVLEKDVKAGFGETTINKVWKNLIKETPYMGAIGFNEKKARALFDDNDYAFADTKMDGRYANIIIYQDDTIEMVSRQGKRSFINNPTLIAEAIKIRKNFNTEDGIVLNGELIINGLSRYESNGLISSVVTIAEKVSDGKDVTKELKKFIKENNKTYEEVCSKINISVWDWLPLSKYQNCEDFNMPRFERLDSLILNVAGCSSIKVCDFKIVKSYEEALKVFAQKISIGEEGIILKKFDGPWKDGKGNHQLKVKMEHDCDLRIYGFNEGEKGSKNEGKLGSFKCESIDGILKCDPSGISDALRESIWEDQKSWLGKIITVKSNGISADRNGNYSLLHPRFKELRTDKSKPDTLQNIIDIQNSILGLK